MKYTWKKHKEKVTILLCFALVAFYVTFLVSNAHALGETAFVRGSGLQIRLPNDNELILVHPSFKITIAVVTGDLNATGGHIDMFDDSGHLQFKSSTTSTIMFSSDNSLTRLQVNNRGVNSGESHVLSNNVVYDLRWGISSVAWGLPLSLIFGLVGICGMFFGPMFAIRKAKDGDYKSALTMGVLLTVTGFALFYGWLMS